MTSTIIDLPGATLMSDGVFWRVHEHAALKVLWVERTDRPFTNANETIDSTRAVLGKIRPDHIAFGLVVDVRRGVIPNDASVQPVLREMRLKLATRVRRIVLLVSNVEATMTVREVVHNDHMQLLVTRDPVEARLRVLGG